MSSRRPSSIESLVGIVAPEVLLDAITVSQKLTDLGIPHALVGGLAVGLYGHPRATKDVDLLVQDSAFEVTEPFLVFRDELKAVIQVGVVDLLAVPKTRPVLGKLLQTPTGGGVPVIPLAALVLMKLDASRPQDLADIHRLLDVGGDVESIGGFLAEHAADVSDLFAALLDSRSS